MHLSEAGNHNIVIADLLLLFSLCFSFFSHLLQSFDFLSLSAGAGGLEANDGFSTARKGLDTFSKLQVPSLPSLVQNHTPLSLSFPPSSYSSAYLDYSSAQQVLQLTFFFVL